MVPPPAPTVKKEGDVSPSKAASPISKTASDATESSSLSKPATKTAPKVSSKLELLRRKRKDAAEKAFVSVTEKAITDKATSS